MKYEILDADGNVINVINATEEFVSSVYEYYREYVTPEDPPVSKENQERSWRNKQLKDTDWVVPIVDYPKHSAYLVYRQELRDWPDSPDFPNTRPVAP